MHQHGVQSGTPTLLLFLFGSLFVAVATAILLVGTKFIPVNSASGHAPYWLVTAAGISFACGGAMVWRLAFRQIAANMNRRQAARLHPDEAALQDYPWDPRGFTPRRWMPAWKAIMTAAFLTIFLSMFNWWAFIQGGPIFLKGIVGLFDLFSIYVWYLAMLQVGRAWKFGDSRIEFLTFPYRLSRPIAVRWRAPSGLAGANKGSFTLRCVEEFFEQRGRGSDHASNLVHEEVWSGTWFVNEPQTLSRNEQTDVPFDPPTTLPGTSLRSGRTVFWELEVKLEVPGLDFEERYLVPVY